MWGLLWDERNDVKCDNGAFENVAVMQKKWSMHGDQFFSTLWHQWDVVLVYWYKWTWRKTNGFWIYLLVGLVDSIWLRADIIWLSQTGFSIVWLGIWFSEGSSSLDLPKETWGLKFGAGGSWVGCLHWSLSSSLSSSSKTGFKSKINMDSGWEMQVCFPFLYTSVIRFLLSLLSVSL